VKHLAAPRRSLIVVIVIAVAGTAVAALLMILVVIPLLDWLNGIPGALVHWHGGYYDRVNEYLKAQNWPQGGGTP
jgi:hypothetical protein